LRSLLDLLEQMAVSTETDPEVRLADLERRRAEIEQVRQGNVEVIDVPPVCSARPRVVGRLSASGTQPPTSDSSGTGNELMYSSLQKGVTQ